MAGRAKGEGSGGGPDCEQDVEALWRHRNLRRLRPERRRGLSTGDAWCRRVRFELRVPARASRDVTAALARFAPGLLRRTAPALLEVAQLLPMAPDFLRCRRMGTATRLPSSVVQCRTTSWTTARLWRPEPHPAAATSPDCLTKANTSLSMRTLLLDWWLAGLFVLRRCVGPSRPGRAGVGRGGAFLVPRT
jgi:hypothetical protein